MVGVVEAERLGQMVLVTTAVAQELVAAQAVQATLVMAALAVPQQAQAKVVIQVVLARN